MTGISPVLASSRSFMPRSASIALPYGQQEEGRMHQRGRDGWGVPTPDRRVRGMPGGPSQWGARASPEPQSFAEGLRVA